MQSHLPACLEHGHRTCRRRDDVSGRQRQVRCDRALAGPVDLRLVGSQWGQYEYVTSIRISQTLRPVVRIWCTVLADRADLFCPLLLMADVNPEFLDSLRI